MRANSEKELLDFVHGKLIKHIELVDQICLESNINYSLHGGTLLGAVRHKGFIPWDDDADIVMKRDNFEIFEKNFSKFSGGDFVLERDGLWVYRIKEKVDLIYNNYHISNISTDIFILDNASDNILKHKFHVLKLKFLQGMLKRTINFEGKSLLNNVQQIITHIIGKMFPFNTKMKLYDRISQKYNSKSTNYLFISNDQFKYIHQRYEKDMYNDFITTSFEDKHFSIIRNYSDFLEKVYGKDYMAYPRKELQKPNHLL